MSSVFPDWQKFAVHQRRPLTGCNPTGYELILRSVGAIGVDFATFQDDFGLDKNLKLGENPKNNFGSVATEVRQKYPSIHFGSRGFQKGMGADKLAFVEQSLVKQQPVLVSIANAAFAGCGWHIMPVVDATANELILLRMVDANGTLQTCRLRKDEFVRIHDDYDGGDDVAYIEAWE